MKVTRDCSGEIRAQVTLEDVRKAVREYKLSPELRKMMDENRKAVIDAAIEIHKGRGK